MSVPTLTISSHSLSDSLTGSESEQWYEAEEDVPRSASCSNLDRKCDMEALDKAQTGSSTGDLTKDHMSSVMDPSSRNGVFSTRPSQTSKTHHHHSHSMSLSSLEALRELLSARRSTAGAVDEKKDGRSEWLGWLPDRMRRWSGTQRSATESDESFTERELAEAFRQAETRGALDVDEADRYRAAMPVSKCSTSSFRWPLNMPVHPSAQQKLLE